jgi:hypothetical protein
VKNIVGAGLGMVALLVTVVILGLMSSSALNGLGGSGSGTLTPTTAHYLKRSTAHLCSSASATVEAAVAAYDSRYPRDQIKVESGVSPGDPSTYPHGTQSSRLLRSGYLRSWPTSHLFALSLSTTLAGAVEVYVPARAHRGVIVNRESQHSGCNILKR